MLRRNPGEVNEEVQCAHQAPEHADHIVDVFVLPVSFLQCRKGGLIVHKQNDIVGQVTLHEKESDQRRYGFKEVDKGLPVTVGFEYTKAGTDPKA